MNRCHWMPLAIVLLAACAETAKPTAPDTTEAPLRILVPTADNLQVMSFWIAVERYEAGGGRIELLIPPVPQATGNWLETRSPDVAVLPAPVLLDHIARGEPTGPVHLLLVHDPINLVVRRSVAEARGISREQPLRDRLLGLQGLSVGVAPHPPPRLDALFRTAGLETRNVVEVVILAGKQQNRALAAGDVDALFAHTPYLERALVHQDAMMLVHGSAGEIESLANRVVHCAVASAALTDAKNSVRDDPASAATLLRRRFPERDPTEIERIVALYRDAIPVDPNPTVEQLEAALRFYPAGREPPALTRAEFQRFLGTQ